jgi:hypothetical protein
MQRKRNPGFLRSGWKQVVTIRATVVADDLQSGRKVSPMESMERLVKTLMASAGISLMLLASHPALAQHDREGRRAGPAGTARPPKPASAQEAKMQVPDRGGERRGGPMTTEERQQLRRDVNDHGREIYRDRAGPKPQQ